MKKLIVLAIIIGAAYHFNPGLFSFNKEKGAFDEQGNPITIVFTHDRCGRHCNDAVSVLKKRRVSFSEYPLDNNDANQSLWKEYGGVNSFPGIIVGNERVYSSSKAQIASALAVSYGDQVLTSSERYYMKKHFNADGTRRLVMYGASWCGYCKKMRMALKGNNIDYIEIDVEKSPQRKAMTATLEISGFPLMYYGYKRMPGPRPDDVLALF